MEEIPSTTPDCLKDLVQYFRNLSALKIAYSRNGAGKTFLQHFLSVKKKANWVVMPSTTLDPRSDWCGYINKGGHNTGPHRLHGKDLISWDVALCISSFHTDVNYHLFTQV